MSIELKDRIGTVTVTVHWDVQGEKPEVGIDVNVESEVFPASACLASLASACRRAADKIDKQVGENG